MATKTKKTDLGRLRGKLKQVIDPGVAKALSHPLRGHILMTLGERVASPNEIAKELGLAARDLDYHVKVLVEVGMITLVGAEQRRGVKEHFYELRKPALYFDTRDWRRMPEPIRTRFSASLLKTVIDEAVEALEAGTFDARTSHQSRTPMVLDEEGWSEVTRVMCGALDQVLEIERRSAENLQRSGREGIPIEVFMIGFETAPRPAGGHEPRRR
jgi:DNA-binding transcriptional ArsR family regulator